MKPTRLLPGSAALLAALTLSDPSSAFCGFYVSGATSDLYNNATQVVLMREGTRTVLSMANNYKGPPQDFAMVVPVPVILQKENVKVLHRSIFQRIDQLAAPRLVEYWEQDPCASSDVDYTLARPSAASRGRSEEKADAPSLGVKVEARFEVGEYDVVILSARDSGGLDAWLRQEKYSIPKDAEPTLKPYVQAGMKFFVARVNISKVVKNGDRTMLSPLRFHYDSEKFDLPVRLGLLNSSGKQDLLVHILARGKRYEVANYPNVTIPTNLDVGEITRAEFATFYAALFDQTIEKHPKAVVTEYAWDAGSCDPCPTPALSPGELATLGFDVLEGDPPAKDQPGKPGKPTGEKPGGRPDAAPRRPLRSGGFVLTRLHARYGKELGEDLVFKEAQGIAGGREIRSRGAALEQGAQSTTLNNFQARYAIRHPWKGPADCSSPRWGRWGGPPTGSPPTPRPATDLAFAPRGKTSLASFLAQDLPEMDVKGQAAPVSPVAVPSGLPAASASAPALPPAPTSAAAPGASGVMPPEKSCAGCALPPSRSGAAPILAAVAALAAALRRRPRAPR